MYLLLSGILSLAMLMDKIIWLVLPDCCAVISRKQEWEITKTDCMPIIRVNMDWFLCIQIFI